MNDFDAVIAGGGLSGLSLAAALATGAWRDKSVLVVDDAPRDAAAERWGAAAESWGFWSTGGEPLAGAVSQRFRRVRVHAAGRSLVVPLAPFDYCVVRRRDLESLVRGLLADRPGFVLRTGTVEALANHEHGRPGVTVTIGDEPVTGDWVFDSTRLPIAGSPPRQPPAARMAFFGREVRCEQPVFDPETPVFFDFRTPASDVGAPRFGYVLPIDRHRALVEITELVPGSRRPSQAAELAEALARYLRETVRAGEYQSLGTESGVLPLRTTAPWRRSGRIMTIGAKAGLIKASTGYGFQRIQADSAAIAASLERHGHPLALPCLPRRHRFMDAVLLEVLDAEPARIEPTFARLFSALPPALVLRFLGESSHLFEDLRLAWSLPPAPYLRAIGRIANRRRRTG